MKWIELTNDPNDFKVREIMLKHINSLKKKYNGTWDSFIVENVKGKKTLDIGIVEHNREYIKSKNWLHKKISKNSSYCLGIDILTDLVDFIKSKGYNVRVADATSNEFLGEKFERINIGDVIEHVNNPIDLLSFAKRHLEKEGEIVVTTPNPFYFKYFYRVIVKKSLIVNFDHVNWVTPTMAIEIANRANLQLENIIVPQSKSIIKNLFINSFFETLRNKYVYVFKHTNE